MNDGKCTPFKRAREKREFIKRIKSQCMFPIDRWALIINISSQFLLSESLYRIMLPACTEHSRLYIHQWWCFRTLSGICRKSSEIFEHENIWLLPTWGMWWCDNNMRDEKIYEWVRDEWTNSEHYRHVSCLRVQSSLLVPHSDQLSPFSHPFTQPCCLLSKNILIILSIHTQLFSEKGDSTVEIFVKTLNLYFWSLMSLGRFRCDENISRVDSSLWVSSNNRYLSQSFLSLWFCFRRCCSRLKIEFLLFE